MFVILKYFRIHQSNKINVSRYFCFQSPICTTSNEGSIREKATHIADLLNCSVGSAILLIGKNPKILALDDNAILNATAFCTKNMRLSDVIENPSIISTSHKSLDRRLHTLKELGCTNVRGRNIVRFDNIIKETPKSSGAIPHSKEDLLKILVNCSPTAASKISSRLLQMREENYSLSDIKVELNIQYLMLLFQCPRDLLQLMLKKSPFLLVQSIENMNSVIKVVTEKLGFTIAEVYSFPFILTLQDSHIENILEIVPTIMGISIKTLAQKEPLLLKKSPIALQRLEVILKNHEITSKQLANVTRVLTLSPAALKHRLQVLFSTEEFTMFRPMRGFLNLVFCSTTALKRIKLLKEANISYSLSMLTVSENSFKSSIIMDKGLTNPSDIIQYLSKVFNCCELAIRSHLSKYPKTCSTSVRDAYRVINFLLEQGVTKEQLWEGILIIMYKYDAVEKAFQNLPYFKEFQPFSEWKNHFNLIQLLIYAIHKKRKQNIHQVSIPTDTHTSEIDEINDSYKLTKDLEFESIIENETNFETDIENETNCKSDIENDIDFEDNIDELYDSNEEEYLMSDAHKL